MAYQLLLVDDDAADRAMIRRSLRKSTLDVELLEATDGRAGLAILDSEAVHCVLLDYRLPDLDGLAFIDALAKQRDIALLPIVMLTGAGSEAVAVKAMKRGAADYLVKDDLTPAALQRTVTHALELTNIRAERNRAEARYRDLFENAHDLIQSVAPDGTLLYVNPAWREALGYSDDEIEHLSSRDIIHPDSQEDYQAQFRRLLAGDRLDRLEVQFVTKDGHELIAEGSVSCQFDNGRAVATRGIFRDITARRQMEDALRLRTVAAEAATDGIVIAEARTPDQPIIYASRAFLSLTGYSEDEVLGHNCRFLQGPETNWEVVEQLKQALQDGRPFSQELLNYRKDGEPFWNLLRIEPLSDASNQVQYFVGTQTDISARKNMEQTLFKEKERLQTTLHSIGDGVITTDAEGRVEFMNPIAEALTGWLLRDAREQPLERVFQIVNENTLEPAPNPVAQCIQEKRVVGFANHTLLISRNGDHYGIQDSAAPIRAADGEVLGAVLVFQDVTEARGLAKQVEYQARHDALTGLLNRREFELRLGRALGTAQHEGKQHAVCYLDLDNFKIVNDTAGHVAGDALLKQIAHLLGGKLRARDSLARLGGDEFSVLLESCPFEKAYEIANSIVETIRNLRFTWEEHIYEIGVSIGIVPVTAEVETIAQLLTQADVACYAAKGQGRNRVVAYHADDGDSARRHREMLRAASLRNALEKDRFCLYGQLIAPLAAESDLPPHYELLLRLQDDSGELLLPGAFIPAAERYHLMGAIDRWVIQTALQQHRQQLAIQSNVGIAINLSGNSLTDDGLLEFVREQLVVNAVPPERVCFEITETAAISNLAQATRFIAALKDSGCRFALDDFGSGLSSFNYLKQFPIDYLKIDGSFVSGILNDSVDRAMVESINHIGHVMGIKTIAEWAEDQAILDALQAIGVDYAQGYAVGRPTPLSELSSENRHGLNSPLKQIDEGLTNTR